MQSPITLKEVVSLLIAAIVIAFVYSFRHSFSLFYISVIFAAIVLIFNILGKKISAYIVNSNAETKIWSWQRWGFYERSYLKTPLPFGVILPFFLSFFSLGYFQWYAPTQTEITPSKSRVAKSSGLYRYSELTEFDIGAICATGIGSVLFLSIIAYLLGYPDLARMSIYFASYNLFLPISKLDGAQIFFGSRMLWWIFAIITAIFLAYALFLP